MPRFAYSALDASGREILGEVDAPDAGWVSQQLADDELIPLEIAESVADEHWADVFRKHMPIGVDDLSLFSSQFAIMLDTGLPIVAALELLAESSPKMKMRQALTDAISMVREGTPLNAALAKVGPFPPIYINMVRAGETSGTLVEVLQQLSSYLDRDAELKGRLKGAMAYPIFLVVLSLAVVTFLMVAIIPKFTEMLTKLGVDLPLPTRALIAMSSFFVHQWVWLVLGLGAVIGTIFWLLRDPALRLKLDATLLKLPLVGELISKNSLARFCFVLGSLLHGGIAIVDALEISGRTAGNRQVSASVADARKQIIAGRGISDALSSAGTIPALVRQMVKIGEATGNLDTVLLRIAEIYDQQVRRSTDILVRLIEPAMIVVLGGVVGFIAVSLVLPMVKAVASFGG
jgi:type IV pilus assembly protein PilC